MRTEVTEFRTRKGHRVYKRFRIVDGNPIYASHYTLRAKQGGKTAYFHLGQLKREAGMKADEVMAFLSIDGHSLHDALIKYSEPHRNRALRNATPPIDESVTVGTIIDNYTKLTHHLSHRSVETNIGSLRWFAGRLLGLSKTRAGHTNEKKAEWMAKVDAVPLTHLTLETVEKLMQKELDSCKDDYEKAGSRATTLNSRASGARALFAKNLLRHYAHLSLPDPLPFHGVATLPEPSHRYHSRIDAEQLIEEAKQSLRPDNQEAWVAFILCIGAGLRRGEVDRLLWENVDFDKRRIWIHTTEEFRPKAKNSESYVDVSAGLIGYLREYSEIGENAARRFVLPGSDRNRRHRCFPIFDALSKWLRAQGITDKKPLHTLRKEAGSMIFQQCGSIDKVAQFLRNDPDVARDHYVGRKERLQLELPGL